MYATMEPEVNSQAATHAGQGKKHSFTSEKAKSAIAKRWAPTPDIKVDEVQKIQGLSDEPRFSTHRDQVSELLTIQLLRQRQRLLSTDKKDHKDARQEILGIGLLWDKLYKARTEGATPQNLIINLFNGSGVGSRLSQALGCQAAVAATAQVVDSTESASPSTGEAVE
jgi:hypothetical protein